MKKPLITALLLVSSLVSTSALSGDCYDLKYNMAKYGTIDGAYFDTDQETGNEVSKLQQFLREEGSLVAPVLQVGSATYGPATRSAVKRFQSKYFSTTPGVVGPTTRKKIKDMTCSVATPTNTDSSVTPPTDTSTTQGTICNSEQNLVNGKCENITIAYVCPNGTTIRVPGNSPSTSHASYCATTTISQVIVNTSLNKITLNGTNLGSVQSLRYTIRSQDGGVLNGYTLESIALQSANQVVFNYGPLTAGLLANSGNVWDIYLTSKLSQQVATAPWNRSTGIVGADAIIATTGGQTGGQTGGETGTIVQTTPTTSTTPTGPVPIDQCECKFDMNTYGSGQSCQGIMTSSVPNYTVKNLTVCKMYKAAFTAGTCHGIVSNGNVANYTDNNKCDVLTIPNSTPTPSPTTPTTCLAMSQYNCQTAKAQGYNLIKRLSGNNTDLSRIVECDQDNYYFQDTYTVTSYKSGYTTNEQICKVTNPAPVVTTQTTTTSVAPEISTFAFSRTTTPPTEAVTLDYHFWAPNRTVESNMMCNITVYNIATNQTYGLSTIVGAAQNKMTFSPSDYPKGARVTAQCTASGGVVSKSAEFTVANERVENFSAVSNLGTTGTTNVSRWYANKLCDAEVAKNPTSLVCTWGTGERTEEIRRIPGGPGTSESAPVSVIKEADQTFFTTGTGPSKKYDIYRPSNWVVRPKMPALVWLHGGSWTVGDKSTESAVATAVASLGVSVIVPNYTFGSGSVGDVSLIAKNIFEVAATMNIDSNKISLGGGSAGAHLALMAATKLESRRVPRCVISVAGPTDLPYVMTQVVDYPVTVDIVRNVFGENNATLRNNSPIYGINSLNSATKFLIAHQRLDNLVPFTQATRMVDAMKGNGLSVDTDFRDEPNPYPTKATVSQLTHLFNNEGPSLVESYFKRNCI
jgi:acetyl esterase/lipase/peptidoglycan hydrolase-like protein with peptidoglycan-binding domain